MDKILWNLVKNTLIFLVALLFLSCSDEIESGPAPIITEFAPASGIEGSAVRISGNHFVPPGDPKDRGTPMINTSIVKFNGVISEAEHVWQDSIGIQTIRCRVPAGTTTGKITITANGLTAISSEDYIISIPDYVPNVVVSTAVQYYEAGRGIDLDADGNFYLTDRDLFKIMKVSPDATVETLFTTIDDPQRETINFGIAVDSDNNVFASVGNTIRKISPDGIVEVLAGSTAGYADGKGTNAQFNLPWGIELDADGNIYVCDWLNYKIRKITPDGTVTTLAGSSRGFTDGKGDNAQFRDPRDIVMDDAGNLFLTDPPTIRKISSDGDVTTIAGSIEGYIDGPSLEAQFVFPYGIELDTEGNLYIGDMGNYVFRRITTDGNVATLAGSTFGYLDGPGANALFGTARGIVLDSNDIIYVADDSYGNIRKIVIE